MNAISIRMAAAAMLLAGAATVMAAQPQANIEKKEAKRAAFLRGDAATKAAPVKQPRTEAQAISAQRVLAGGIVEMQLPEDRMLELTAIKRADGSIEIGHNDLDAPAPVVEKEASL